MRRFLPFAALFGVALVLGCQDVGTGVVASDGPGPQFDKPGKSGDKCPDPSVLVRDGKGHCHEEEPTPPGGDPAPTVTITGDAMNPAVSAAAQDVSGPGLLAQGILVDLSGFPICNLGMQTGQLFMPQGDDHVHFSFQFMHTETGDGVPSQHTLSMLGVLVDGDVLPPLSGTSADIVQKAGEPWAITSKGKNHKNGCKGEGATVNFTVTFAQPSVSE